MSARIISTSEVLFTLRLTKPGVIFLVVATTKLGSVSAKRTEKCFIGPQWKSRDDDIDHRFSASQSRADACVIATLAPSHWSTLRKAAAAVLGLDVDTEPKLLKRLLVKHRNVLTLVQVENMAENRKAKESNEYEDMRTDGHINFAFVATGDKNNSVSVVGVCRSGLRWVARVYEPDIDRDLRPGDRLIVPNLVLKR